MYFHIDIASNSSCDANRHRPGSQLTHAASQIISRYQVIYPTNNKKYLIGSTTGTKSKVFKNN
jgi:hypothetical protein